MKESLIRSVSHAAIAAGLLGMLGGCDWFELGTNALRDKRGAFAPIVTGANGWSRDAIERAMGTPDTVQSAGLAGLEAEYLNFTDRNMHYSVLIVNGKAWLKTASPLPSTTTPKETTK